MLSYPFLTRQDKLLALDMTILTNLSHSRISCGRTTRDTLQRYWTSVDNQYGLLSTNGPIGESSRGHKKSEKSTWKWLDL